MSRFAKRSVVHAWIVCCAILFGALAPTLSHAFTTVSGLSPSMEICTAAGVKLVPDSPAKSPFDTVLDKTKHCGNCVVHDHNLALIPPGTVSFAVTGSPGHYPFLFYQARSTLFPWTVAQSRAPPAFA